MFGVSVSQPRVIEVVIKFESSGSISLFIRYLSELGKVIKPLQVCTIFPSTISKSLVLPERIDFIVLIISANIAS